MKKILFVHHASVIGGGTISAADIISMIKNDYDVEVLISTTRNETKDFFLQQGFKCIDYKDNMGALPWYNGGPKFISRTFWYCIYKTIKFKKMFLKLIEEHKPDIVILNSIILSWLGPLLNKKNIKSICFVRETRKGGIISKIQEYFLSTFDSVCFISEYDEKQYNLNKIKKYIVRDCVKEEKFNDRVYNKYNIDQTKFNVLYLGGDSELKGWLVLKDILKNIDKIKFENINFLLLGEFSESEKIKSKSIRYLGNIVDIENIFKYSNTIILPSTKAHQLRPMIEAGFSKCPVIVSSFKEISENMIQNKTCITIEPNNSLDLEEKIILLSSNKQLCREISDNNYSFVKSRYEYKTIKKDFVNILETI